MGQIPYSLLLLTPFSLQPPIFRHIIPLINPPVHNSLYPPISGNSWKSYTALVSFSLSHRILQILLFCSNKYFPYSYPNSLTFIPSILPNIPHVPTLQLLFNSAHPIVPLPFLFAFPVRPLMDLSHLFPTVLTNSYLIILSNIFSFLSAVPSSSTQALSTDGNGAHITLVQNMSCIFLSSFHPLSKFQVPNPVIKSKKR
jgi:hypothetical protein